MSPAPTETSPAGTSTAAVSPGPSTQPDTAEPVGSTASATDTNPPGPDAPAPGEPAPGEPAEGAAAEGEPTSPRRSKRWLVEWGVVVVVAVVLAVVVRAFLLQTYYVPSTSMYPTLKPGDRIVVEKVTTSVRPGDIIVFSTPPAENGRCGGGEVPDLVKRVIALGGQTVEARNDKVYVTGKVLPQPWLPAPTDNSNPETGNFAPVKVPQGDYFVMGDNRASSCDSRTWGPVKASSVVGKVFMVVWPLSRFHFL